jgi:hypothetical protein
MNAPFVQAEFINSDRVAGSDIVAAAAVKASARYQRVSGCAHKEELPMSASPQPVPNDVSIPKLLRRTTRLLVFLLIVTTVMVASVSCLAFLFWKKSKAIDEAIRNQSFSQFVIEYDNLTDFVTPEVNTIQFLRRGYSISFDSVQYTQEGLVLSGTIGNPTQLWISSLALNFTAKPYPHKIRDKWDVNFADKNYFPWWDSSWDIGSGQTTVGLLNPGTSAPFHVTIPNVKQTSDSIHIAVGFTGERYQYLR